MIRKSSKVHPFSPQDNSQPLSHPDERLENSIITLTEREDFNQVKETRHRYFQYFYFPSQELFLII
jgi:hypothetical protein